MNEQQLQTSTEEQIGTPEVTAPVENMSTETVAVPTVDNAAPSPMASQPSDIQDQSVDKPKNEHWKQINQALKSGASRKEISSYMATNLNYTEDDADLAVIETVADKIKSARAKGATDDQIKSYMIENNYAPEVIDSAVTYSNQDMSWKDLGWSADQTPEDAMDLADLYSNVYSKKSTMLNQVRGWAGNREAAMSARDDINQLNASLTKYLTKEGFDAFINPNTGEVAIRNEQGVEQPVDSSMLNGMWNAKAEAIGSIGGAIAGGKTGKKYGTAIGAGIGLVAGNMTGVGVFLPEEAVTVPAGAKIGGIAGQAVGAFLGGAAGAAGGRGVDLTINAVRLKEQLEADLYKSQMIEAGIADGVFSVVGGAAIAGTVASTKALYKGSMRAFNFIAAGNSTGALKVLKENMHLSDDQALEIIENFKATLESPLRKTTKVGPLEFTRNASDTETAIAAIASTTKGAEGFVGQSAGSNPKLANALLKNIDERAKALSKSVDTVADENVGAFIRNDLKAYTDDVKKFYGTVKDSGIQAVQGTDFRFDYDKLAIDPVLKSIEKKIADPRNQELYLGYAQRIANASEDRTFGGLIELRQAVNDFKFSKSKLAKNDYDALNTVLNKIDAQIGNAAKEYIPNSAQWKSNWTKAKQEYAKMRQLEDNATFKALNRATMSEEQIQRLLNKYGNDLDVDRLVYNNVVERLSPATRKKVEGAAIKSLTKKYTMGESSELQVVNFPVLNDAIKGLNINTPEGKHLAQSIDQMSRVFKNDKNLASMSGSLTVPQSSTYLTDNPKVRAKMALMSSVFNAIKRFIPGRSSNNLALINQLDNLLENPMNVKNTEAFMQSMPEASRPQMRSLVEELRQQQARAANNGTVDKSVPVKMYKQTTTGKFTVTDGKLGKGIYLVDKVKNPSASSKVIRKDVDLSRIATIDTISAVTGKDVTEDSIRKMPEVQQILRDNGYLGIGVDGKVMLFPENVVGTDAKRALD